MEKEKEVSRGAQKALWFGGGVAAGSARQSAIASPMTKVRASFPQVPAITTGSSLFAIPFRCLHLGPEKLHFALL